jgi:Membrane domain of glycerophosphoryl diester phosphodiesterase
MPAADLRPMSLGELLDRTFSLYKNNFTLFAGIVALPYLVLFLFEVASSATQSAGLPVQPGAPGGVPRGAAPNLGLIAGIAGGALIFIAVFLVLTAVVHAATIFAVSDLYLGRPASVRASFRRVRGKVLTVIGISILNGLIVMVGFILLIIPGIIFACRVAVAVPAAMLEGETPVSAINRSWELTKGHAGDIFLIGLLVAVMGWIVAVIFELPFILMAGPLTRPHALPFGLAVLQHLGSFIAQVLVGPIGTIAYSLMYYNLRVQKEAFDIQHLMASLGPGSAPGTQLPGAASPV